MSTMVSVSEPETLLRRWGRSKILMRSRRRTTPTPSAATLLNIGGEPTSNIFWGRVVVDEPKLTRYHYKSLLYRTGGLV